MSTKPRKHSSFRHTRFITEFWEAWLLALFLVTILGFFGKSQPRQLLTQTEYNRSQFNPMEPHLDYPAREGRPLESGF